MTDKKKSMGEELFDEQDAEYNPVMSIEQLRSTTPDTKLTAFGKGVLVRCEARVVEGDVAHTIAYFVITEKPEEVLFTSGPVLTTKLVSSKPLTPKEQKMLAALLRD